MFDRNGIGKHSADGRFRPPVSGQTFLDDPLAALVDAGEEVQSSGLAWLPKARVPVEETDVAKLMRPIESLEDHDDIDAVHANFDIADEVLERAASV